MLGLLFYPLRALVRGGRNLVRRVKRAPDYVVFVLEGNVPELPPRRESVWQRLLGPPPVSLRDLASSYEAVARDRRVKGVVLHLRPLSMPFAKLQTLRDLIRRLREAEKHVVAWSSRYETASYYVASAADEILMQPGGSVDPLGIKRDFVFLADALDRVGVKADFLQISPYKTGMDALTRDEMSEEMREMMNWLLDDLYGQFLEAIAVGRGCGRDSARALIDGSPATDVEAVKAGAVDGIVGEEALADRLGAAGRPARLAQWEEARKRVLLPPLDRPGRYVALLRIEGDIVDGRSRRSPRKPPVPLPFLLNERAGDLTVVQEARRAKKDPRAAAVVVYVESGGGSATASEAMAAALGEVARRKPLVVAMGPLAASGGYYVATSGRWIVAQPGTLTGSIGVIYGKLVGGGVLEKLRFNRETIARGRRAMLYDAGQPFSAEERRMVWNFIERIYEVFLERVSTSRKMSREQVDGVGGGRVWTGRQALERGLVDELGGVDQAVNKARELAGLSERAPVREIIIPAAKTPFAPIADSTDLVSYALEGIEQLRHGRGLCICPLIWEEH